MESGVCLKNLNHQSFRDPLTDQRKPAIFNVSVVSVALVAHVSVMATSAISADMHGSRTSAYVAVRCPNCDRRVMDVPSGTTLEVRVARTVGERTGRGRVVTCQRCHAYVEVLEHPSRG